jgi:inward rectifier potassium channel
LSIYNSLLTLSWGEFLTLLSLFYIAVNGLFAFLYIAVGGTELVGPWIPGATYTIGALLRAFFFSVETFATIGYGHVAPVGLAANVIMTIESFVGLLSVALVTGIAFARFSRPTAKILYSRNAVIAPFQGILGFMFRCANVRKNQLINVSVRVIYSRIAQHPEHPNQRVRTFTTLPLEYNTVTFFALSWTVVHPIDQTSPLWGCTLEDLVENDAEFLILLSGTDDTTSQMVHSRTSYKPDEMIWNARFASIFVESPQFGTTGMNLASIHDIEFVS